MSLVTKVRKKYGNELVLLAIFVAVFLFMGFLSPSKFFTANNFRTMAFQMPEFGIMALGMMAVVLTGGINLSITYTATMSSIVAAKLVLSTEWAKENPVIGILLAFVVCILVSIIAGVVNGFFVAYIGVAAMLVTLGTMTLFEGVGLNITKGGSVSGFPTLYTDLGQRSLLGIPITMWLYIVIIAVSYILLERSNWGIKVYFTGCNETATRFSGVNTKKTVLKVFVFSSVLAGIAGMIFLSRYNSAKVDYGSSYLMNSVAAVVLGGTSINGGHGSVAGTVIAVAIIQVMSTGLNLFGLSRYLIDILTGVVLIAVLAIRFFNGQYQAKKMIKNGAAGINKAA